MENSSESRAYMSYELINDHLSAIAQKYSVIKKFERLMEEHEYMIRHIEEIPRSPEEMKEGWKDACIAFSSTVLDGSSVNIVDIGKESFIVFENTWLSDIKKYRAYLIWKETGEKNEEKNYDNASNGLRTQLFSQCAHSKLEFGRFCSYIKNKYLNDINRLDDKKPDTELLIAEKAKKLYLETDNKNSKENWYRAKLYVQLFYENIIPAVLDRNKTNIAALLKSFEFDKSPTYKYPIINAFEAAVAINFLNKDLLSEIIKDYKSYDYSTVPFSDWPLSEVSVESDENKLVFDREKDLVIFEGIMSQEEKDRLLGICKDENLGKVINDLFFLSNLRPFDKMVL